MKKIKTLILASVVAVGMIGNGVSAAVYVTTLPSTSNCTDLSGYQNAGKFYTALELNTAITDVVRVDLGLGLKNTVDINLNSAVILSGIGEYMGGIGGFGPELMTYDYPGASANTYTYGLSCVNSDGLNASVVSTSAQSYLGATQDAGNLSISCGLSYTGILTLSYVADLVGYAQANKVLCVKFQ